MRTDAEKRAFAMKCLEIEERGGNVLEYIRRNWPSYTPGGTWFNLQRVYLPTKPLTSGKPEKKGGEETMRRNRMEVLDGVLEAIRKEQHPYDYLESIGYVNTMQAYHDLKIWAKKNAPEKFEQLPTTLKGLTVKQKIPRIAKEEPAPDLKPGQSLHVKLPGDRTEHMSAREYNGVVRMEQKEPEGECRINIVDEIIGWPGSLEVCGVQSHVKKDSKYELCSMKCADGGFMSFIWRDLITQAEKELTMSVPQWKMFAAEIGQALKQLGLSK